MFEKFKREDESKRGCDKNDQLLFLGILLRIFRECLAEASPEIPPTDVENEIEDNKLIDLDQELDAVIEILKNDTLFKCIANESRDLESEVMRQIANNGAEELKKLCTRNEPFWLKDVNEGKFIFQSDKYQRILERRYCLTGPNARVECSRDSRLVNMNVEQLVDIFLDSVCSFNHS